jgi:hypothetical protein
MFVAALGVCRGILYSVKSGDYKPEDIDAVLAATSSENLAQILGIPVNDLSIDYTDYLTEEEIDKLRITTT